MSVASPYQIPGLNPVAVVQNPGVVQNTDSQTVNLSAGHQGDLLVSDVHAKHGNAAARGNLFFASSPLAGSVVPLSAANQVVKFALWNPIGSGKNVELHDFSWQQFGTGTEIVTQIGLAFQTAVSSGVPSAQTTKGVGGPFNAQLGLGQASVCTFWTVMTMANPAIGNGYQHFWLFNTPLATTATSNSGVYSFDGKIIMPPDTICTPVAALTGTEIEACMTLTWAEWPI